MSNLQVRVPTGFRSMSEARESLDEAVRVGEGRIDGRWDGDELHLTGPGATARVTLENGEFVGYAVLKPPASLFASMIRAEFEQLLRQAAHNLSTGEET